MLKFYAQFELILNMIDGFPDGVIQSLLFNQHSQQFIINSQSYLMCPPHTAN